MLWFKFGLFWELWKNIKWIYEPISGSLFCALIDLIAYLPLYIVLINVCFLINCGVIGESLRRFLFFFKAKLDILKLYYFPHKFYSKLGILNSNKIVITVTKRIWDDTGDCMNWRDIDILAILTLQIQYIFLNSCRSF